MDRTGNRKVEAITMDKYTNSYPWLHLILEYSVARIVDYYSYLVTSRFSSSVTRAELASHR